MIIDPLMIHAGVPNHSNLIRLSADFRYQLQGTQTHWESHNTMEYAGEYFTSVLECLDDQDLEPGVYENVWEKMRLAGPDESRGHPRSRKDARPKKCNDCVSRDLIRCQRQRRDTS